MGAAPDTSERKFKQIGSRPSRHDGLDKVTGRARFGADFTLPGALQGVFVRSHGKPCDPVGLPPKLWPQPVYAGILMAKVVHSPASSVGRA